MIDPNAPPPPPQDGPPQNGPDDGDSQGVDFNSLPPEIQNELLKAIMQGKPQNAATLNQARQVLSNDPDTVALLLQKLGIQPPDQQDDQDQPEEGDDDNGR